MHFKLDDGTSVYIPNCTHNASCDKSSAVAAEWILRAAVVLLVTPIPFEVRYTFTSFRMLIK